MNDQTYMMILRALHILFGIFWAGSAIYFSLFIIPALKSSGPEGVKFMQHLAKTGYPVAAMLSALISIIAGVLLVWKLSGGLQPEWFGSNYGRTLTVGAVMAIIAFIVGVTVSRPAASRIGNIGQMVAKQGGMPTKDQMEELTTLRKRIFTAAKIIAVLVTGAAIAMSVFRYVS